MGTPFSFVIENAREEALSSDLVRMQQLASREAQDVLRDVGRSDENLDGSLGYSSAGQRGTVIDNATLVPALTAIVTTMTMDLSAGQVFRQNVALSGDESTFEVVRIAAQTLTFTGPAGNPRVDLVYAMPGTENVDLQNRNILLDPVARTVAPATVPKTQNPLAAVFVVDGTPAASGAAPPALPAGGVALFEVMVPVGAGDSTVFSVVRRTQRSAVSVMPAAHAILRNSVLRWSQVDESTTTSVPSFDPLGQEINKVVIDGEVVAWRGGQEGAPGTGPVIIQDAGGANPLSGAADTFDAPYYFYVVGGRNAPQGRFSLLPAGQFQPICVVESTVEPDKYGRPTSAITPSRGSATRAGALFIGIGFTVANTAGPKRRKACLLAGDWVYAKHGSTAVGAITPAAFNQATISVASGGPVSSSLATRPATGTSAAVKAIVTGVSPASVSQLLAAINIFPATGLVPVLALLANQVATATAMMHSFEAPLVASAPEFLLRSTVGTWTTAAILATAYNMRVPRLSE